MLPGTKVFFLASDGPLTTDVAARLAERGVAARYVSADALRGLLTADRLAELRRAASAGAPVNRDFRPVLYYRHLRYWIRRFDVRFGVLEGALLAGVVLLLVRVRPVPLALFTTGFAASSLEVVLLLGFQVLCGSVYYQVALIVTMFMLGLAVGSLAMNRLLDRCGRRELVKIELGVAAFAGVVPLGLLGLARLEGPAGHAAAQVAVPAMALLLAALVGMEFPLAGKADFRSVTTTAGRLYAADLAGACLGALLVSTLLIPRIGVAWVCALAAALNLASGLLVRRSARA